MTKMLTVVKHKGGTVTKVTVSDTLTKTNVTVKRGNTTKITQSNNITKTDIIRRNLKLALVGRVGPQGPKGDKGEDGTDGVDGLDGVQPFIHNESPASDTWVITHNLGRRPSVSVYDTAGTEYEGCITHNSINQLTITFSAPFSGTAYLI